MRMVFADHVADDARRLVVRLVALRAELVHGEQHAAMDRLEAVAHIGECAPHDHAHGVIEVAAAHLVFEVDRDDFPGEFCHVERFPAWFCWPATDLARAMRRGAEGGEKTTRNCIIPGARKHLGFCEKTMSYAGFRYCSRCLRERSVRLNPQGLGMVVRAATAARFFDGRALAW